MIFAGEGLFLVELVLLVYCVLNIVTTPDSQVRNLPKLVWLLLVVVLPLVGGIAWLVGGRPAGSPAGLPYKGNRGVSPGYGAPRRSSAGPDDDEAFLRGLRARAESQRREAERRRLERPDRGDSEGGGRTRPDGGGPGD